MGNARRAGAGRFFRQSWRIDEGFHPPGGNFLLVQKVTKNTLRGSTPKDPGFWEQGRGVYCFARRIDSGITYGPWHLPKSACRPVV